MACTEVNEAKQVKRSSIPSAYILFVLFLLSIYVYNLLTAKHSDGLTIVG